MKLSKEQEIIKVLFKDFLTPYNSRSVSKIVGISHAGAFKILKKLEKKEVVKPKRIGKAVVYSLNLENPVACKEVEMTLVIEAQNFRRWSEEFKQLQDKTNFLVLFGSIIRNEKQAGDIDILIVADKDNLKEIKKIIEERQKFSNKKIHPLFQTKEDFSHDVAAKNKVMLEIIKTGIALYGQEEYLKILKSLG